MNASRNPTAIFAGLSRENFEHGLAYCGRLVDGEKTGFLLVVFVILDERMNSLVAFDWEFRPELQSTGLPVNWQNDFKVKL